MFRAKSITARLSAIGILSIAMLLNGCGVSGDDSTEQTNPANDSTPSSHETFGTPLPPSVDSPQGDPSVGRENAATDDDNNDDDANANANGSSGDAPSTPAPPTAPSSPTTPTTPTTPPSTPPPAANPGPPPPSTCAVSKDANGFFTRTSAKSDYVAYVPASYSPSKPMRVIIGLHGCGDNALNFAKWGVNPWDGRATQQHIGISVGGETGGNKCWSMGNDDDKVMAAVDDLAKCFWVNRSKLVVAGFSSGGQLAYRVGLTQSSKFAGILIENSGLYAAGAAPSTLLSNASWKIPIAHHAHTSDSVFPITKVKADWSAIQGATFPLTHAESGGTHDGSSDDWMWLIPLSASWTH